MTVWRVNLSTKLWRLDDFIAQFPNGQKFVYQSKGRCAMRDDKLPKHGDTVYFVNGRCIRMKGIVEHDGFLQGDEHQRDIFNIPQNPLDARPHALPEFYAKIKIKEVGILYEGLPISGQRTWAKVANINEWPQELQN